MWPKRSACSLGPDLRRVFTLLDTTQTWTKFISVNLGRREGGAMKYFGGVLWKGLGNLQIICWACRQRSTLLPCSLLRSMLFCGSLDRMLARGYRSLEIRRTIARSMGCGSHILLRR